MNRLTPNALCAALTPCAAASSSTSARSDGVYRRATCGFPGFALTCGFPLASFSSLATALSPSRVAGARDAFAAASFSQLPSVLTGTPCAFAAPVTPSALTSRIAARRCFAECCL